MPAILFGSISTVSDTSELQREAFNQAFSEQGLDWSWDRDDYRARLEGSGGANRIAEYADERGEEVDADAVHQAKSEAFQRNVAEAGVTPRAGVAETIAAAKEQGWKIGFVTTTSAANLDALFGTLSPGIDASTFDVVVDSDDVDAPKPDPAAYAYALEQLGEKADDCVAVEDNLGGVQAAHAAGIKVVAFPNVNTAEHDFADADSQTDRLDFAELSGV